MAKINKKAPLAFPKYNNEQVKAMQTPEQKKLRTQIVEQKIEREGTSPLTLERRKAAGLLEGQQAPLKEQLSTLPQNLQLQQPEVLQTPEQDKQTLEKQGVLASLNPFNKQAELERSLAMVGVSRDEYNAMTPEQQQAALTSANQRKTGTNVFGAAVLAGTVGGLAGESATPVSATTTAATNKASKIKLLGNLGKYATAGYVVNSALGGRKKAVSEWADLSTSSISNINGLLTEIKSGGDPVATINAINLELQNIRDAEMAINKISDSDTMLWKTEAKQKLIDIEAFYRDYNNTIKPQIDRAVLNSGFIPNVVQQ